MRHGMPEPTTEGQRVLIVDDDDALRRSLGRNLRLAGFEVTDARDGGSALDSVRAHPPDVIVLDVTMPGIDGVELTRRLRALGDDVAILILSARDGVDDRIVGLEAGADDYLVKPFIPGELLARLRALLRRRPEPASRTTSVIGPLRIEPERQQVFVGSREVTLTKREFDLLAALATRPGVVFNRAELLARVWGYPDDVHTNVVDVFVGYLRRKLEADGEARMIQTVRGRGFTLRP
jgi:two-component system response regulator PrrA